jgi:PAP2 superfamily
VEMTLIVVALLATAGGVVVVAASGLRWAAVHRKDLLAAGQRASDRARLRWLPGLMVRLRPAWRFGVSTGIGLVIVTLATAGAGKLMEDITEGDGVAVLDRPVASFVTAHRTGVLTMVMEAASSAGGPVVLGAVTIAAGVVLGTIWRSLGPVLAAGVTVAGNGVLTVVLKDAVGRPRPPLSGALAAADGYAFPSGHAATAAAAFGVLALLCTGPLRSRAARVAIWASASMLTTLVGISRIYLGVHWTTDVTPAAGHNQKGIVTYGAARRTYALPELIQVVNSGDFESVLSFGVGLAQKAPFRMYAQPRLGRVVLDVKAPFRTVPVRDYFLNSHRFADGRAPYTEAVYRPVIPPATAFGAMQRLFAGPTQAELARGLKFVSSGATGFKILGIRDGVARVQLLGKICSGGSTFTIANQIMPTLKQFRSIHWVKIYDARGHTERPFGHSDSIPFSLEP